MFDVMCEMGINVVVCIGYYQDVFFLEYVVICSVQELVQEMVDEIEQGIDGMELKVGIIVEIGISEGKIMLLEEKVFIVVVLVYNQIGCLIFMYMLFSMMGLEQLVLLQVYGVDFLCVIVGYCDLKDNFDNILKMIDFGVYVQFDIIGKNSYYLDEKCIVMFYVLCDCGLLNCVMLLMDIMCCFYLKVNGGYGYDYLLIIFIL